MAWVIDSCILLDVALDDPSFGNSSASLLEKLRPEGLTVCPMTVIELAPQFGGSLKELRRFLALSAVRTHHDWTQADTEAAVAGWARYVRLKRGGRAEKRPIADILIGGFALRFQGLVTRNEKHFKPYYPKLVVRNPSSSS